MLLRRITARAAPRPIAVATLSTSGKGRIGEKKQMGDEKDFASKRDAELLRNLAAKTAAASSSSAGGGAAAAAAAASLTVASAPFGAPILPFHHAFPVHSLAEARAFYRDMLGCEEGRSSKTWIVRAPQGRRGGTQKRTQRIYAPPPPLPPP